MANVPTRPIRYLCRKVRDLGCAPKLKIVFKTVLLLAGLSALALGQLAYRWMHAPGGSGGATLAGVAFPDLDGRPRHLSEWQDRIVVVNFWASWCPPCRAEIPDLAAIQSALGSRGVQFVGIAIDDANEIRDFLQGTPVNYPVLIGQAGGAEWARALGNHLAALPFTAIFHRGRLVHVKTGPFTQKQLREALLPWLQAT